MPGDASENAAVAVMWSGSGVGKISNDYRAKKRCLNARECFWRYERSIVRSYCTILIMCCNFLITGIFTRFYGSQPPNVLVPEDEFFIGTVRGSCLPIVLTGTTHNRIWTSRPRVLTARRNFSEAAPMTSEPRSRRSLSISTTGTRSSLPTGTSLKIMQRSRRRRLCSMRCGDQNEIS